MNYARHHSQNCCRFLGYVKWEGNPCAHTIYKCYGTGCYIAVLRNNDAYPWCFNKTVINQILEDADNLRLRTSYNTAMDLITQDEICQKS